eukprot:263689_1
MGSMELLLFIMIIHHWIFTNNAFGCRDRDRPRSWWLLYKKPNGFDYIYYDSAVKGEKRTDLNTDDENPIFKTISSTWNNAQNNFLVAFNDKSAPAIECIEKDVNGDIYKLCQHKDNQAHSKGILAIDFTNPKKLTGFWIIHSYPGFPAINPGTAQTNAELFSSGDPDGKNAQSFLCLSLPDATSINIALGQLLIIGEVPYARICGLNTNWANRLEILNNIRFCNIGSNPPKKYPPSVSEITFKSISSGNWLHFASGKRNGEDMTQAIGGIVQQNFVWQTWPNTPTANKLEQRLIDDLCTTDVYYIQTTDGSWGSTKDHSKMGVSFAFKDVRNAGFICIGDMNRHLSQEDRGGGFACNVIPWLNKMMLSQFFFIECPTSETASLKFKRGRNEKRRKYYDSGQIEFTTT